MAFLCIILEEDSATTTMQTSSTQCVAHGLSTDRLSSPRLPLQHLQQLFPQTISDMMVIMCNEHVWLELFQVDPGATAQFLLVGWADFLNLSHLLYVEEELFFQIITFLCHVELQETSMTKGDHVDRKWQIWTFSLRGLYFCG